MAAGLELGAEPSSWVVLPAPSTPSKAMNQPRPCVAGTPGVWGIAGLVHADELSHLHLGAALGAGGGGLVLVAGEQAAAGRAGLGQRRLPEREIAVGVAVAAVEGLATLGALGDDFALAALGAAAEGLLAQVLIPLHLG